MEFGRGSVELGPDEAYRFVLEAPRINDFECLRQHWIGDPDKKGAVPFGDFCNRERPDIR